MKKFITLLVLTTFLFSCAPRPFNPAKPLELKFDPTADYSIQEKLAALPKPDKLVPVYVSITGDQIVKLDSPEGATHILLVPKEYAKIGSLLKLAKTYKSVAIEQEHLINTYISEINALKELVALERQKTIMYRELWVDSENRYRQERHEHTMDNAIHKTGLVLITIGSFIALALAL